MVTHWQANGNCKSNAAHNVPAHTMHIAMNWSTDVTGMQVASNFHRCYKCDVWLHLPGNCNDVCDAICDMLQVRPACNTSQWSMCICSRALSTLWIVASNVCIWHHSPATPRPAWTYVFAEGKWCKFPFEIHYRFVACPSIAPGGGTLRQLILIILINFIN